ncbi:MAG: transposase [Vicinamibacterales bacterium]
MGKRTSEQAPLWVATTDLPVSPGHPFYAKLNTILDEAGFDQFAEGQCREFYAPMMGRPSLPPGRYFRLLLVGYFEGLDSERGIAWRAADSLAVRTFVGLGLDTAAPDHSTISRTRRLIALETHRAVFTWVQERLAAAALLKGRTVAIDATTLEANAAMRSIVRRDTGATYQEFLTRLAAESGLKTPTRAALARLDRRRKKRTSNKDWQNPFDPDAKITKMKDGRTHLAHKAEHAIDLESGAMVAVTVQGADVGDTTSLVETALAAAEQVEAAHGASPTPAALTELIADKGYHSNQTMIDLHAVGVRSYIAEPERGRRSWTNAPDAQHAVYGNRRRIRGARGQRLMRRRGEYVERSFAHVYDTGGMRRTHLRGHPNILKRLLIHASAFNLGILMRQVFGRGTPRGLQGHSLDPGARDIALAMFSERLWVTTNALLAPLRLLPRVARGQSALAIA